MRTVPRRMAKLEDRFPPAAGKPGFLVVVGRAGWGHALDMDACIGILHECGLLPTNHSGFHLVNLCQIPDGMNAQELERFLREKGAEMCAPNGTQNHGVAALEQAVQQGNQKR